MKLKSLLPALAVIGGCATAQDSSLEEALHSLPIPSNQQTDQFLGSTLGSTEVNWSHHYLGNQSNSPRPPAGIRKIVSITSTLTNGLSPELPAEAEITLPTATQTSSPGIYLIVGDGYGTPPLDE